MSTQNNNSSKTCFTYCCPNLNFLRSAAPILLENNSQIGNVPDIHKGVPEIHKEVFSVEANVAEDSGLEKSDYHFMMSVIHEFKNLSQRKKMKFKRQVLQILDECMFDQTE